MGAKKLSDADKAQAVLDLLQGKGTMASLEKVAGFLRNARPLCSGLGGRLRPEWVAGLSGIHSGGRRREAGHPRERSWSWNSTGPNSSSANRPW